MEIGLQSIRLPAGAFGAAAWLSACLVKRFERRED
jgi:hypothetical protein